MYRALALLVFVSLSSPTAFAEGPVARTPGAVEWSYTEGAPGGGRYSPLADIHAGNVSQLRELWSYQHGDFFEGSFPLAVNGGSAFEGTPLVFDGRIILTTPRNRVIALDAEAGRELWSFDPELSRGGIYANMWINRGVAAWRGGGPGVCGTRLFLATLDARLIALDAGSGAPCADFGEGGTVDLLDGIAPLVDPMEYNVTSPGTVVGDVIVVGSSVADTLRVAAPPGDVRAFDVRSGALRWTFHPLPGPADPGFETWGRGTNRAGATNVWSTITADPARGLVFLPVSTPSPDFYGGDRPGSNLFSDSVVALDAASGAVRWHFQTVHHDLWDYDLAAPPNLVQVLKDGVLVDAVAQATKTGMLFVLDRETGVPLFPVEERPVPASDVPGENAWPTQPFPVRPPPLVSHGLPEADLWDRTPEHLAACKEQLAKLRNEGIFTPPSERGTIVRPFTGGGANWSGAGYDPRTRRLVVPMNDLAHVITLSRVDGSPIDRGTIRPLRGITLSGLWRGMKWLITGQGTGMRYRIHPLSGRVTFQHDDLPCEAPPWGVLVAVDLDAGEIRWSVPTSSGQEGDPGFNSYGPPLVTAGGLVFHGGTRVPVMRVHDLDSGERLATFPLPAGLHAGPVSYRLREGGPQILLVAAGGHVGLGSPLGDSLIAFGLPEAAGVASAAPTPAIR